MIGFLSGKVIKKLQDKIIVNVQGVGYNVLLTEFGLEQCNENDDVNINIYTHVREQEITLYGFFDDAEQEIFELLISVSGIGPKAGLKILAVADVQTIILAIANEDTSILTKVSGIGPKIAKKVVNELSGKVVAPVDASVSDALAQSDAIDALRSMGYTAVEARNALEGLPKDIIDVGECVKYALKNLGK